jgi:hypothetical protein
MRTLNHLNNKQKSPESADYSKAELSYARAFARTMQVWIRDVFAASRSTAAPTIHVTSWQTLKFSTGVLAQDTVVIDGVVFLGEHIPEAFLADTFFLGIAVTATFLWRGSGLCRLESAARHRSQWLGPGLREHRSLVQ